MNDDILYVNAGHSLRAACAKLEHCAWLAVDTEFERVNTYYPELCLLQVAGEDTTVVFDPLAIDDLGPLYEVLYNPAIVKVFHAARQDLELFYQLHRRLPGPVFDTQVAAALLGYEPQMGYAGLVKEILDKELPKSQTRTDWKRRPLSGGQLRYAADDVIYLGRIYRILQERLMAAGKLQLFELECLRLDNPILYEPDPADMWRKIRATKRLPADVLALVKPLAAWRELTARRENRPRKWILPDHTLIELARQRPEDREALAGIEGMDEKLVRRYGDKLLELIGAGRATGG